MSRKVFLLEDDAEISQLVKLHLEAAGHEVIAFRSATGFVQRAEQSSPELFLLDIMVPGGDGRDVCAQIRKSRNLAHVPIVFLTARASEEDRVFGLEQGADDYITKPFSPRELVARVKAVLRRFERPLADTLVQAGEIEIDPVAMKVTVRGDLITTTATEFRLLEFFARNAGRVFTRDRLLDAVWRDTAFVTPRSVDVYVRRLREKIERDPEDPQYLRTMRGIGYKFEVPPAAFETSVGAE
ncbi:MAG: response regulator transcription factor [Acidobacteriales bacterium]|nr:response regulator transcription factor [Terriglobales bacterium]